MRKYNLDYVPDEEGDGFIMKYLYGETEKDSYLLVIDYDTSSTYEKWKVIYKYTAVSNSVPRIEFIKTPVYNGNEVPEKLIDTLIELVLETKYLTFRTLTNEEFKEYFKHL